MIWALGFISWSFGGKSSNLLLDALAPDHKLEVIKSVKISEIKDKYP